MSIFEILPNKNNVAVNASFMEFVILLQVALVTWPTTAMADEGRFDLHCVVKSSDYITEYSKELEGIAIGRDLHLVVDLESRRWCSHTFGVTVGGDNGCKNGVSQIRYIDPQRIVLYDDHSYSDDGDEKFDSRLVLNRVSGTLRWKSEMLVIKKGIPYTSDSYDADCKVAKFSGFSEKKF